MWSWMVKGQDKQPEGMLGVKRAQCEDHEDLKEL